MDTSYTHTHRHIIYKIIIYLHMHYIYNIYNSFFKSKGTVCKCIGMINRLIDRKINPVLRVPVKQEYEINEEKMETI